jgi:hypothetical protein
MRGSAAAANETLHGNTAATLLSKRSCDSQSASPYTQYAHEASLISMVASRTTAYLTASTAVCDIIAVLLRRTCAGCTLALNGFLKRSPSPSWSAARLTTS